ncbi:MAG: hypothetical protein HZA04_01830 [Nitrospinae bacterium]|nr:hypothetical protein [Nitrospinota bacterium]
MNRVLLIAGVVGIIAVGIAQAIPFAPGLAAQRALIHASGASTYTPPPPPASPPAPTPSRPPTIYHVPGYHPGTSAGSKASSGNVQGTSSAPNGVGVAPGKRGQVQTEAAVPVADRPAEVVASDGRKFSAERVSSGIENDLRIDTGRERVSVKIADTVSIEFGKKELNRLEVAVRLADGGEIGGSIYSGTVFEFVRSGGVVTARAEELGSVTFQKEKQ